MFHRIIHENWVALVPIIAFAITFTVFLGVLVRAISMKKDKREHLAALPLTEDSSARD